MRRRDFITLLGGSVVFRPLATRAQPQPTDGVRHIGMLVYSGTPDPYTEPRLVEFLNVLKNLGWVPGRNLRFDYRWNPRDAEMLRAFARELVSLAPDVVVVSAPPVLAALRHETRSIPIVFVEITDPVGQGFVESLAHPGGNCTGNTDVDSTTGAKHLALLKEIAPDVSRVAVLFNPDIAPGAAFLRSIETAAPSLAVTVIAAQLATLPVSRAPLRRSRASRAEASLPVWTSLPLSIAN